MTSTALRKLILKHYPGADDGMATHILAACKTSGLPLSYGLALVEMESGFKNVFGHDPTRSIPSRWYGTRVTLAKYVYYRARRRLGYGMQGVGPVQLTWYEFQDQADRIGGCRKPYPNMVTGFRILRSHINRLGKEKGAAAYNGTGDAAEDYGRRWVRRQAAWHARVT
jgi:hypothetical protein